MLRTIWTPAAVHHSQLCWVVNTPLAVQVDAAVPGGERRIRGEDRPRRCARRRSRASMRRRARRAAADRGSSGPSRNPAPIRAFAQRDGVSRLRRGLGGRQRRHCRTRGRARRRTARWPRRSTIAPSQRWIDQPMPPVVKATVAKYDGEEHAGTEEGHERIADPASTRPASAERRRPRAVRPRRQPGMNRYWSLSTVAIAAGTATRTVNAPNGSGPRRRANATIPARIGGSDEDPGRAEPLPDVRAPSRYGREPSDGYRITDPSGAQAGRDPAVVRPGVPAQVLGLAAARRRRRRPRSRRSDPR